MGTAAKRSLTLVNLTTGLSDGLLLPLAACTVASSLFPGDAWRQSLTGIGAAVLGSLVFGLARSRGEKQEIHHNHPALAAKEAEQEATLMKAIGIDPELSGDMQQQMEEERELWLSEVSENDMGWDVYDPARAAKSGLETGIGFLAGGVLVSLVFCAAGRLSLLLAFVLVGVLLYLSGWYKGKLVGKRALYTGLFQLAMGLLTMLAALTIMKLIGPDAR